LEIKYRWTAKHLDPVEAIEQGIIKYIEKNGDLYSLVPGGVSGYYEQVQGRMAVVGVTNCDFVVWTPRGMLMVSVGFDQTHWDDYLKSPS
jgi:hypothetical protein